MTDWMSRPKALDRFTAQDRRMERSEKRMRELEAMITELGIELRREVKRLEPTTPVELPGGEIDEAVRTVTLDEPAAELPTHGPDHPDAVHYVDGAGEITECGEARGPAHAVRSLAAKDDLHGVHGRIYEKADIDGVV